MYFHSHSTDIFPGIPMNTFVWVGLQIGWRRRQKIITVKVLPGQFVCTIDNRKAKVALDPDWIMAQPTLGGSSALIRLESVFRIKYGAHPCDKTKNGIKHRMIVGWLVSPLDTSTAVPYHEFHAIKFTMFSNEYHIHYTIYPKKYAHGFVVLCFVVVM